MPRATGMDRASRASSLSPTIPPKVSTTTFRGWSSRKKVSRSTMSWVRRSRNSLKPSWKTNKKEQSLSIGILKRVRIGMSSMTGGSSIQSRPNLRRNVLNNRENRSRILTISWFDSRLKGLLNLSRRNLSRAGRSMMLLHDHQKTNFLKRMNAVPEDNAAILKRIQQTSMKTLCKMHNQKILSVVMH